MPRKSEEHATQPRAVTMMTIADIVGVTQATVSRAINNPEKVSKKTLDKINDAIALTGYVPNLVAGALASSKSKMIAAIIPSITNIVYAAMVQKFSKLLREAGYQTILVESGFSFEEEQKLVNSLLSRRPDGILLTGIHHSNDCRRQLLASKIPVVEVWDYTENPIDICVGFSHTEAGAEAANYAINKGYTNAAVVSAGDERALRRRDAFCNRYKKLGFSTPKLINYSGAASIGRGRSAMSELAENNFKNGVIFCSSDLLAHGVLIEANARGVSIPEQISVIGFGDQDYAQDTIPPLTSIKVDRARLGKEAANALLERISGNNTKNIKIDIGFEIIQRETT